jgi:hypothetical protein
VNVASHALSMSRGHADHVQESSSMSLARVARDV